MAHVKCGVDWASVICPAMSAHTGKLSLDGVDFSLKEALTLNACHWDRYFHLYA